MEEWITVKEAARIRNCTERNILKLINKGDLEAKKDGRRWLVLMDTSEPRSETGRNDSELTSLLKVQLEERDTQTRQLQEQLAEKDKQIEKLQGQLEKTNEALAEASHRHDTVVMQMTRLLEYHQQPFWRRWRKRKQLPETTIREEEQ